MPNATVDPASLIPPDPAAVERFRDGLARSGTIAADARFGVAVSGGPDSLALLLLADAAFPDRVEAATIDHALRAESASEAATVATLCQRLAVPHMIFRRTVALATGRGTQAAARDLRYPILQRWCADRGLALLLTGHHADDQAETLLMRLRRGAGIDGLGGIRPARAFTAASPASARIVRPLLDFTKADLVAIVAGCGVTAADDPSNDHEAYDRTHARRLLAANPWLEPRRLAASARHLAEAAAALEWAATQEWRRRVSRDPAGHVRLDPDGLPGEILRRVVERILSDVGGESPGPAAAGGPPRPAGPDLARLIARLQAGKSATLGTVLARPGPHWRFTLAPPRRIPPIRP